MIHSLPFDVEFLMINQLTLASLLAYAAVSRRCRLGAQAMLAHRVNVLLQRFCIPADRRNMFWAILATARGGLTGSFLAWMSQPDAAWWPDDLNIVVGCGGVALLSEYLGGLDFNISRVPSRTPKIIPYPNVPPIFPYNKPSIYNSRTVYCRSKDGRIITVTETGDEFPLRLLMECEHSVQAGLWTPSVFIHLYPWDLLSGRSVRRGGSVFRRFPDDRLLDMNRLAARGIQVISSFRTGSVGGCDTGACPGITRRLRGGRGVLVFPWGRQYSDRIDVLGDNASRGFMDGRYALLWTWGTCENYRCSYYGQPTELVSLQSCPIVHEDNTKMERLLWKCEAVRTSYPAFKIFYEAMLFPTSCIHHLVVPIPLDYHAKSYLTIDDLRWHTWICPRPFGAPRFPMFFPPTASSGSVVHASVTARRLYVRDGYSIVVLMQSTGNDLRRNILLFTANSANHRAIHGDVLVLCFKEDVIISPHELGLEDCIDCIQEWWAKYPIFDVASDFPSFRTPS